MDKRVKSTRKLWIHDIDSDWVVTVEGTLFKFWSEHSDLPMGWFNPAWWRAIHAPED